MNYRIDNTAWKRLSVAILDLSGKQIYHKQTNEGHGKIDIAKLSSGIYLFNLKNLENGVMENVKFVKD